MYIAPNSTIELFKNLKLDNSYANTMWFANASAQNTFYVNHRFTQLNNYSYQRKDIGVIRVEGTVSSLYDVNYMRFKNTSFENKWFYAFVTRVEYVNNATVNMYYAIDVIQTYMFDWQLQQCLVERQHSTTDVAGDNLMPEGLELGDYINSTVNAIYRPVSTISNEYCYLICVGLDDASFERIEDAGWTVGSANCEMVSNQFSALAYLKLDQSGENDDLRELLADLNDDNKIDSIVSITMIPSEFTLSSSPHEEYHSVAKPTLINGYTPVNKKLLTYPYCYMDVYNDQNEHEELRFELSTSSYGMRFKLVCVTSPSPEAVLIPQDYDGHSTAPEHTIVMGGFPQVPYFNDAYKAWQALNYDQMAVSRQITAQQAEFTKQGIGISQKQLLTNTMFSEGQQAINAFGQFAKGNFAGALGTTVGMVGSAVNYGYEDDKLRLGSEKAEYENYALQLRQSADESRAKNLPNSPHVGSSSSAVSCLQKGFWYNIKTIRRQYAERIDKYFTMFGYAQNIVAVPNIHARQYFTYVKTTGSCVSGSIPQDDRETIDTIFDRGIRFWTNYDYFENYTVNNAII